MSDKKKLLVYSDCFLFSGSENVIENILSSPLLKKNYSISFTYVKNKAYYKRLMDRLSDENPASLNIQSIFILRRDYAMYKVRSEGFKDWKNYLYLVFAVVQYALQKLGIVSVFNLLTLFIHFLLKKPDIIFINNGGYPGALSCRLAVLAAKWSGVNNIVFNINNMAFPKQRSERLDGLIGKYVTKFVTASYAAQKRAIEMRGFTAEKFVRIPNTVKSSLLHNNLHFVPQPITNHRLRIGTAGLLTQRKGFNVLVDAANEIKKRGYENFQISIIGYGEEFRALQQQILDLELSDNVQLLGFKNNVLDYLREWNLFVLPAIANEDFPYVILEAMASALPIIGTRVAGIPEQVADDKNGYVVEPGNASELADKIITFIKNPEILSQMGGASRELYKQQFSYEIIEKKYEELFESLDNI